MFLLALTLATAPVHAEDRPRPQETTPAEDLTADEREERRERRRAERQDDDETGAFRGLVGQLFGDHARRGSNHEAVQGDGMRGVRDGQVRRRDAEDTHDGEDPRANGPNP